MKVLLSMLCLVAAAGSVAADERKAADELRKAKAQVVQDRNTKAVTEVRFTSRAHGDALLDHVAACKGLVKLFIAGPGDFSDEGLGKIAGLKRLEFVELHSANFTDLSVAGVAQMPRVKWLGLSGTKVSDAAGDALGTMKNLEMLSVAMTGVGNDLVAKLVELPSLRDLHLTGTKVDDEVFAALSKMKALRLVALHGTKVTPGAVEKFKKANPNVIVGADPPKP